MRRWLRALLWMLIALSPFVLWCDQNFRIRLRHSEIMHSAIVRPLRIIHISDLHGLNWGSDNAALVRRIAAQQPDLICVTGDMFTRGSADGQQIALALMRQLVSIAPTCFVPGEHDRSPIHLQNLASHGVLIPDSHGIAFNLRGNPLRIFGCSAAWFSDSADLSARYSPSEVPELRLLLCHIPRPSAFSTADMDLMLSGDTHGGLIRLPGIGALHDGADWFPALRRPANHYIHGSYSIGEMTLSVTSGLGGPPLRLGAPPEISVIDLLPSTS